jgi:uncharacterized protein (DUF2236 family)
MRRQGAAFGIPLDRFPTSYEAFRRAFEATVETLTVGEEARELGHAVLHPPAPRSLRPAAPVMRLITAGLLPEPIRRGYGLPWGPRQERSLALLAGAIRTAVPLLPDALRRWPHARDADRRDSTPRREPVAASR